MEIKVDKLIKELEKYRGKTITKIQILDINLNIELDCINNIVANERYIAEIEDNSDDEITLFLDAR